MDIDKKQLTEEDIKHLFITPTIEGRGWNPSKIAMEKAITDGKINLKGNVAVRFKPKKAEFYILKKTTRLQ